MEIKKKKMQKEMMMNRGIEENWEKEDRPKKKVQQTKKRSITNFRNQRIKNEE